ncbi:unnamed protein product [Penicillium pancosmium]
MGTHVLVHNCTVEDTELLARNNITAFWEMTWWRMLWIDTSLDTIIKNSALRMPHNLLTGRLVRRHQKIIDHGTGQIIGYARWILPEVCAPCWLEAQTPDVSEDNKRVFENQFAEASWAIRDDMPGFDDPLEQMMKRNSPTEPYINHQRKGIASLLLESGIKQAKKLNLSIFLVAIGSKALALYQKYGFDLVDQNSQDLRPWGFHDSYDTYILLKR